MKKRKNRPLILTMAAAFALVAILMSTFAWWSASDQVTNRLKTQSYGDAKITEIFDENEPLDPGSIVDKKVGVVNTGQIDAIVRISFTEALTLLANDGKPVALSTKYDGAAGVFPKLFEVGGSAYAGWTVLTNTDPNFSGPGSFLGKGTGTTVIYNKTTANGKDFYEFAAYTPLDGAYAGKYQFVDLDITLSNATPPVIDLNGSPTYYQFTQGAKATGKWAALSVNHAPLNAYPAATPDNGSGLPEMVSALDSTNGYLKLIFGSAVTTDLSTATAGQWWYAPDGYFYYIGKLASGQKTANLLLNAIELDIAATAEYFTLEYELTPCMDAVQAIEDAVLGEWGSGTNITDFIARLKALTILPT